ncbi:MAG: UbiD family decarboxylase [Deltaproteobacteria bacterium]|nr:UbiD family decarboxylase [Deltaproteobacteria bacterium]
MGYSSLRACVDDLARARMLRVVDVEIDPYLEMGEVQRRVYARGGPALLFTRPKGTAFPMLGNLFGTLERARWIFRDTLEGVRALVDARVDPRELLRHPARALRLPGAAAHLLPRTVRSGPVLAHETTVSALPRLTSWPDDGGPFITLPQVYTEDPDRPGLRHGNLGMYRVQLSGNDYARDREVGLHYQLHRGIGVHHAAAVRRGEPLPVSVFVGGPPAMTLAAVMPLPEGLPEIAFAGALGGRAVRMLPGGVHADADFVIRGVLDQHRTKPEGPFGDHLGYYSRRHEFPFLRVEKVLHRDGAIWPFTTVGRPPQEDTTFGELIHELTAPLVPDVLPGVHAVHAVDAAGVHPLLLAIGSERYTPHEPVRRPMELLTQANAILGQGQMSLAKYLFIVARRDAPDLDVHDVAAFLRHVLERVDPTRDLHFQTNTTIDTLDYSGPALNEGSKLVIAAVGDKRRELPTAIAGDLRLPDGFSEPRVVLPGVLAVRGPRFSSPEGAEAFAASFSARDAIARFPLVLLVDDSDLVARSLDDFLWVTFTRSDPAVDVHGIESSYAHKAWGCRASIVVDARTKPHHAPPLEMDAQVIRRVDALAAPGGPLHGLY